VLKNENKPPSALKRTGNSIIQSIPIILGVLSLVSLIITVVPVKLFSTLFTGNKFFDPLIGSALGSIFSGNPITSYIISGELHKAGISAVAIVAFMIAWVTVGIVQAPAEALILDKKFTVVRNIIAFFSAILIAVLTVNILGWG